MSVFPREQIEKGIEETFSKIQDEIIRRIAAGDQEMLEWANAPESEWQVPVTKDIGGEPVTSPGDWRADKAFQARINEALGTAVEGGSEEAKEIVDTRVKAGDEGLVSIMKAGGPAATMMAAKKSMTSMEARRRRLMKGFQYSLGQRHGPERAPRKEGIITPESGPGGPQHWRPGGVKQYSGGNNRKLFQLGPGQVAAPGAFKPSTPSASFTPYTLPGGPMQRPRNRTAGVTQYSGGNKRKLFPSFGPYRG